MRHEFSQVHELPEHWEQDQYTYNVFPWLDIGRMAIYLLTFVALFVAARHLAIAII